MKNYLLKLTISQDRQTYFRLQGALTAENITKASEQVAKLMGHFVCTIQSYNLKEIKNSPNNFLLNYCHTCQLKTPHNKFKEETDFGYTHCKECGSLNEYEI